jgi:hypothetical protein
MSSADDRKSKEKESDLEPDAWQPFERAVDVVAKSPPQHRIKKKKAPKRRVSSSKPKSGVRRA